MDKETFHKTYSLFREERYMTRYIHETKSMRYVFDKAIKKRLRFLRLLMDIAYSEDKTLENQLRRMWYWPLPANSRYPYTYRQREISRRLCKWRVEYKANMRSACDSTHDLIVHHLNYDNIGQELQENLEVLCRSCHSYAHRKRSKS